jgi:hypothetical protein
MKVGVNILCNQYLESNWEFYCDGEAGFEPPEGGE